MSLNDTFKHNTQHSRRPFNTETLLQLLTTTHTALRYMSSFGFLISMHILPLLLTTRNTRTHNKTESATTIFCTIRAVHMLSQPDIWMYRTLNSLHRRWSHPKPSWVHLQAPSGNQKLPRTTALWHCIIPPIALDSLWLVGQPTSFSNSHLLNKMFMDKIVMAGWSRKVTAYSAWQAIGISWFLVSTNSCWLNTVVGATSSTRACYTNFYSQCKDSTHIPKLQTRCQNQLDKHLKNSSHSKTIVS